MERSLCRPHAARWATLGRASPPPPAPLTTEATAGEWERQTQAWHFISITAIQLDSHLSFFAPWGPFYVFSSASSCSLLPFQSSPHAFNLDETGIYISHRWVSVNEVHNGIVTFCPSHYCFILQLQKRLAILRELMKQKAKDAYTRGVGSTPSI